MVYRDILPLRAAVECLDTFGHDLTRKVTRFSDIFVKVVKGPQSKGVFIICYVPSVSVMGDEALSPMRPGTPLVLVDF